MSRRAIAVFVGAMIVAVGCGTLAVVSWPRATQGLPPGPKTAQSSLDVVAPVHAGGDTSIRVVPSDPDSASGQVEPQAIAVPALGIEMAVMPKGLTNSRGMALPETADVAAWYRHGALPGDPTGAALIAAHVSDERGIGPFAKLAQATTGMKVSVELSDGSATEYVIVDVAQLSKKRLDIPAVLAEAKGMLVLVTCGGRWDPKAEHYEDNVIAWAVPSEISWSAP